MSVTTEAEPVVRLRGISKTYHIGKDIEVQALRGVDLDIHAGEFIAIMGASGSGKSTLMNILGCLDVPDEGTYELAGEDVSTLSDDELAAIRNQHLGFVFQAFNLLPRLDAVENVELPLMYGGDGASRRERAEAALVTVGLADRAHHRPSELSGGQQQRVAIARALLNEPTVILADEPTGNLDSRSSLEIIAMLQQLNRQGKTVVVVTHEPDIAEHFKRIVRMRDGQIVSDEPVAHPVTADEELHPAATAAAAAGPVAVPA